MAGIMRLCPNRYSDITYTIDFNELYASGKRGILFDIDNTLVAHGAPADKRAIELFERLRDIGFKTCLISNNNEKRVKPFAEAVNTEYVANAWKPKRSGYMQGISEMGVGIDKVVFIGDQLFTDVWGARRAGIYSILVKQIDKHEKFNIVLKRFFEKIIINIDEKNKRKNGMA